MTKRVILLAAGLSLASLASQAQHPAPGHGLLAPGVDAAAKPCGDFYQYANGGWMMGTRVPAEYPSWDASYEIYDRNLALLKGLLEGAAGDTSSPQGSIRRKAGDFYASGMDEGAVEKAGWTPLASRFQQIAAIGTKKDLAEELARLRVEGIGAGFTFTVGIDDKVATSTIAQLSQGGLGLPEREYYTREDEDSRSLRRKYVDHVARMFELLGEERAAAAKDAETVLEMETRLAKASMTAVEKRDPVAIYHKTSRAKLAEEAPGFDWEAYFGVLGLPASETSLLVRQPAFARDFALMAGSVPLESWKSYLRWRLIHATAGYLSAAFVNEDFAFYQRTLHGVQALKPRWKRVLSAEEDCLGEAVGQLFVEKAFRPEAKAKALAMVENLRSALRERIRTLAWMTGPTKEKAIQKLDAFVFKVGYPDKWRDYSTLKINRDGYVLNVLAADAFETRRILAKLGRPVDRTEWLMNAHEVNAYYEPTLNELCFPAGILQPPFFDPLADDAVNYGATGSTIGHEMTHGFDDEGSQYDAQGNLKEWWTAEDRRAFEARLDVVVRQYEGYRPLPDQAINGKLTLGENVADFGGVRIAYAAFRKTMDGRPRPPQVEGFTPEQRFFLAYAMSFRELTRPETLRVQLNVDPHPPQRYRVIGPLSDMTEFYAAFGCAEGDPMWRPEAERPTIW